MCVCVCVWMRSRIAVDSYQMKMSKEFGSCKKKKARSLLALATLHGPPCTQDSGMAFDVQALFYITPFIPSYSITNAHTNPMDECFLDSPGYCE